jgi:hypothetical protein
VRSLLAARLALSRTGGQHGQLTRFAEHRALSRDEIPRLIDCVEPEMTKNAGGSFGVEVEDENAKPRILLRPVAQIVVDGVALSGVVPDSEGGL